ncbi:MAG: hypothetical protein ABSF64_32480 [Bryobacteraceae bacterium]|jgi:hypothetical protein
MYLHFGGENVHLDRATRNQPIQPVKKSIPGVDVFSGLIAREVENALPAELQARLHDIRETE